MLKIKGIDIVLVDKVKIGVNPFGEDIFEETERVVSNVLIAPRTADDVVSNLDLNGRKVIYILGIPKGDSNNWEDRKVKFFNETFRTFELPTQGLDHLIPLSWNKKVACERYE